VSEYPFVLGKRTHVQIEITTDKPTNIAKGMYMQFDKEIPCNKWNWIKIRYSHRWWMRMLICLFPIKMKDVSAKFFINDCEISEADSYGMRTYTYTITATREQGERR